LGIPGDTKSKHLTKESSDEQSQSNPTNRAPAATPTPATYLNVFTVEEYEANGKTQKRWTKIGAAFPHKEGQGFSIQLQAFPIDGRLVVLPPDPADENRSNK
jgi:hypothetical protein